MSTKTIPVSDSLRIKVVDHGDIGVAVVTEERQVGGRRRFICMEDALVPREKVSEVCKAMLVAIGAKNINWEW
jgi:predicted RNA-binding protein with EMAP domain